MGKERGGENENPPETENINGQKNDEKVHRNPSADDIPLSHIDLLRLKFIILKIVIMKI